MSERTSSDAVVCNSGFVPRGEALRSDWIAKRMMPDPQLDSRVGSVLQRSSDPVIGAAGTLLQSLGASVAAAAPLAEQQAQCGGDAACERHIARLAAQAADEAARPWADALAKQAADTRDPALYAIAVQACRTADDKHSAAGNCQLIKVEQWTHIDPDNAVPWLHLASVALQHNDVAAESEALYRASTAPLHRLYGDGLAARAESELPADLGEVDRKRAILALGWLSESWTLPNMQPVLSSCTVASMSDANRRQLCDALASSFIEKGSNLVEFGIGIRIGERVGWPAERVAVLKAEREALFASDIGSKDAASQEGCSFWNAMVDAMLKRSQEGELQHARRALAASGRTVASFGPEAARRDDAAASETAASAAPP